MPRDILCRGQVLQVKAVATDLLIPLLIMPGAPAQMTLWAIPSQR